MVEQIGSEGEKGERGEEMGSRDTEAPIRVSGVRLDQMGKKGRLEEREGGREREGCAVEEEVKERKFEGTGSDGASDITKKAQGKEREGSAKKARAGKEGARRKFSSKFIRDNDSVRNRQSGLRIGCKKYPNACAHPDND